MARIDPRTVELIITFSRGESKSYASGSGYLITPSFVLTAGHLFDPEGYSGELASVEVRPIGGDILVAGSVCWRSALADVALIGLDKAAVVPTATVPVRWGRVSGAGRATCRAVGFPQARAHRRTVDGRPIRDPEPIEGALAPGTAAKSTVSADLHVSGAVPVEPREHDSLWRGLSGAVVFVGPWLVGVVAGQPASFGPDRLSVDLIEAVASEPGFVEQLGQPDLEAADLPRWLRPPYEPLQAHLRRSALILRPKYGVIRFRHRPELDKLVTWCQTSEPYAVKLLIARGGEGKTRLAAELCAVMNERRWLAGFVDNTTPLDPREALIGGVLLVVDYADSHTERAVAAIQILRLLTGPARVLLLARHGGAWWNSLPYQLDSGSDLVAEQEPERLVSLVPDYQDRVEEFTRAAAALAEHLGTRTDLPPPPTELRNPGYANAFLVQLAALTMLDPADGVPLGRNLLDEALRREDQKHWLPLARQYGLAAYQGPESRRREAAVAVPTLALPSTDDRAAILLGTQPELREEPLSQRLPIVEWLQSAYPPDTPDNQGLGALEPDLIGEHLISRFNSRPDGRDRLQKLALAAEPLELTRIFTVLMRASDQSADVFDTVRALADEHGEFLIPLLETEHVTQLTAGVEDLIELRASDLGAAADTTTLRAWDFRAPEVITMSQFAGLQAPVRTILLGPPASGKTTATLMLARSLLTRRKDDPNAPFPIVIKVRELQAASSMDRMHLLDAVTWYWQKRFPIPVERALVDKVLRQVPAYAIFDGMDELDAGQEEWFLAREILALSERYPKLSILITGRPNGSSVTSGVFARWRRFEISRPLAIEVEQLVGRQIGMLGSEPVGFSWLRHTHPEILADPSLLSTVIDALQYGNTRAQFLDAVVESERRRDFFRSFEPPAFANDDWTRRILPDIALAAFVDGRNPAYLGRPWLYRTLELQLQRWIRYPNSEESAQKLIRVIEGGRSAFLIAGEIHAPMQRYYYFRHDVIFRYLVAQALYASRASYEDTWSLVTSRDAMDVLSFVIEIWLAREIHVHPIVTLGAFLDLAINSPPEDQALFTAAIRDVTNASPQAARAINSFRDQITRSTSSRKYRLESQLLAGALDRPRLEP